MTKRYIYAIVLRYFKSPTRVCEIAMPGAPSERIIVPSDGVPGYRCSRFYPFGWIVRALRLITIEEVRKQPCPL